MTNGRNPQNRWLVRAGHPLTPNKNDALFTHPERGMDDKEFEKHIADHAREDEKVYLARAAELIKMDQLSFESITEDFLARGLVTVARQSHKPAVRMRSLSYLVRLKEKAEREKARREKKEAPVELELEAEDVADDFTEEELEDLAK